jgi:MauM/NapG family ferredoxin protein
MSGGDTPAGEPPRGRLARFAPLLARGGIVGLAMLGFVRLRGSQPVRALDRGGWGVLRPPGSLPEEEFLARCIRCTRCADACETQCIHLPGPLVGIRQGTPVIFPGVRACSLCLACGPACPTGAIQPLADKAKARMGVARVDKRLCVSHNGSGVCGACHTVCPLRNKAITQDLRNAPEVHPDHCVGCGLCEEACIVDHPRAIRVRSDRAATIT